MNVTCPNCGATVGEQIGGKLGFAFAGALLGSRMNPVAGVLLGLLGAAVGHRIIDSSMRVCPQCWTILQVVTDFIG
ncbi:MAG TPA: hypothetical protein VMD77_00305 [Candidatus Baltobacteraceae bacterium]|nr:hypothetical protein [Candidatus Baltobacteraceae bacterium]